MPVFKTGAFNRSATHPALTLAISRGYDTIHQKQTETNSNMLQVLTISIPFFALIFIGYAARRQNFCDSNGAQLLSRFAFYVALPPFLFLKVAANEPTAILNWGFLWRYEAATIIIFLLAAGVGRSLFALKRNESGIFGLNSAYPNYGYIGVPLTILAFGDGAAIPIALILFADTIVLLTLTAIFITDKTTNPLTAISRVALTTIKNPLLQSVVAGVLVSASGIELPLVIDRVLTLLAGAAAPTALFALGATLYGQPIRNAIGELSALSMLKLIIHPMLVAGFFLLLPWHGGDMIWVKVAIVSACLPVATNVFVLAGVYGAYSARTASAILITTLLASVTVPITLYMLYFYL